MNLHVPGAVAVRDSKLRAEGALLFGSAKWRAFIQAAVDGRLDR